MSTFIIVSFIDTMRLVIIMVIDHSLMGKRLQQRRNLRGLTQNKLAEIVGITPIYLSKIENGKAHPNLDLLASLCQALDVDVGTILTGTIPQSRNYQNEFVLQLYNQCSPSVRPIVLSLMEQLSKLNHHCEETSSTGNRKI